MGRARSYSIVSPTVVLTSSVAAIAILIGALVSYPLIVASTQEVGQRNLSQLANVTANSLERGLVNNGLGANLVATLERESISAYLFSSIAPPTAEFEDLPYGFTQELTQSLLQGNEISEKLETANGAFLFEGRPLAFGGAVLLVQPVSVAGASAGEVVQRLVISLIIGLIIAIPLGYVAARRLARPLKKASKSARSMADGDRGVLIKPEGPQEVSDIALALNALDRALVNSETRQREFFLSVSHELRTPLTAVKGYSEALADGVLDPSQVANAGEVIFREAQRLDRLVNDLLDLARLGAVDFDINLTEVDLAEFAREACEVWRYRCETVEVTFSCSVTDSETVVTDPIRVRQIIDNLAENALRVTPAGGRIELALSVKDSTSGPAVITICIADTGPGLNPDDIAIAFEPGALHERYRGVRPVGTGLGLALVQRLATGLNGSAHVESSPGAGTRFIVTIPASFA
jgi:two-component system, OmpR family, sensor kinase